MKGLFKVQSSFDCRVEVQTDPIKTGMLISANCKRMLTEAGITSERKHSVVAVIAFGQSLLKSEQQQERDAREESAVCDYRAIKHATQNTCVCV